jgi:SAM-dependent methyltransferase
MNDGFSSLPCERLGPNGEPIDGWTYRPHIASRAEDVGKRFATLYHISPNAHSLLDLGSGTGYVVQCALQLGYDAAGAEIADPYVKMSRERLVSMGHDPGRIIKADFLAENFSEMDINGKRIKDFDIIHIYGLDKNIWRATRTIPQHMKQGSYFVIGGFNEPFFANDAEEFAAKHEIPVILEQEFCGATYCLRRA